VKPVDVATGLSLVIGLLEAAQVEYMIVGSVACAIYGEPRLTRDLDLVISLSPTSAASFSGLFDTNDFYVPPVEIISQEIVRGGLLNLLHHRSGLKVDLVFRKSNKHAIQEFSRRRRIEILSGITAWIAAPEDVIIAKLRFYREGESVKHLTDIRGIIANTSIDREYLDRWVQELRLQSYFDEI